MKLFYYNDSIILCQNFTTLLLGCLISINDYQENNLDIDIKKIQKFITYLNEQLTVYVNQVFGKQNQNSNDIPGNNFKFLNLKNTINNIGFNVVGNNNKIIKKSTKNLV